jgi:hypothetical protein
MSAVCQEEKSLGDILHGNSSIGLLIETGNIKMHEECSGE